MEQASSQRDEVEKEAVTAEDVFTTVGTDVCLGSCVCDSRELSVAFVLSRKARRVHGELPLGSVRRSHDDVGECIIVLDPKGVLEHDDETVAHVDGFTADVTLGRRSWCHAFSFRIF